MSTFADGLRPTPARPCLKPRADCSAFHFEDVGRPVGAQTASPRPLVHFNAWSWKSVSLACGATVDDRPYTRRLPFSDERF
jgi:hypothetical protein